MGVRRFLVSCVFVIGSCETLSDDLGNRDGVGILIDVVADQPSSPANGVLVRVSSSGGRSLELSLEGGTFVAAAACATADPPKPDAGVAPCGCFSAAGQLALSIRPANTEALLTLILHSDDKCSDTPVASRQVAIRPAAVRDVDAGAADAAIADAPIADAPIADAPIADAPIADAAIATDAGVSDAP
jgi:hypothetical protein